MKALFDTNILIGYLNGIQAAREEIGRYEHLMISPITWMEIMVGASDADQDVVRSFLSRFRQVDIDAEVAEIAVSVRQAHNLRLPDAIIWASAMKENALLISRDTGDLPGDAPDVRTPSTL
jgi:predicted nucleic acid-binding protein